MLTEKRIAEMNNLWRKRVLAGQYLTDIPMQRLTPGELMVLATDSLYQKANKHHGPYNPRVRVTNRKLRQLPKSVRDVYLRHVRQLTNSQSTGEI